MLPLEILENVNREEKVMHGLHRPTPSHCCVVLNIVFYSFKNWIILKLNLFINIVLHPGFPQNVTDISHMTAELCKRRF